MRVVPGVYVNMCWIEVYNTVFTLEGLNSTDANKLISCC